jgi:hypothetical protein
LLGALDKHFVLLDRRHQLIRSRDLPNIPAELLKRKGGVREDKNNDEKLRQLVFVTLIFDL